MKYTIYGSIVGSSDFFVVFANTWNEKLERLIFNGILREYYRKQNLGSEF